MGEQNLSPDLIFNLLINTLHSCDQSISSIRMAAKIKLTYFNLRGRAEPSRLILAQAGVDYEDHRIEREEWPALKPKTPCGQLPVLCFNGTEIAQSMTIARFLAKEFGLAGKNSLEHARADMIVDCLQDLFAGVVAVFKAKTDEEKAELQGKLEKEIMPAGMLTLESFLKGNGGQFFVGSDVTWADILVSDFFGNMKEKHGDKAFGSCTVLKDHVCKILNLPNIKKWIEKRPVTPL